MRVNIKYFIYSLFFFFILLISNLHTIGLIEKNNVNFSNLLVVIVLILSIAIIFIENNFIFNKNNLKYSLLFLIFGLLLVISALINENFSYYYIIIYMILLPILISMPISESIFRVFLISAIFSLLPILYWLGFGNTLGMMYALMGVLVFIYLENYLKKSFLTIISIPIFCIILFITESRTSLLSYLIVIFGYYFLGLFMKSDRKTKKKILVIFSILLLGVVVFLGKIQEFIYSKYTNSNEDVLSRRSTFWEGAFNDGFKPFGYGKDYFIDNFGIGNSHNTFIEILTLYGWLPSIFFFLIIILIKRTNITLPFLILFIIMSMAENLLIIDTRLVIFFVLFVVFLNYSLTEKNLKFNKVNKKNK